MTASEFELHDLMTLAASECFEATERLQVYPNPELTDDIFYAAMRTDRKLTLPASERRLIEPIDYS